MKGSIFFRDCKRCTIQVACSQFRCRNLYDSRIYLYAMNDPIIESSDNLVFAPYNVAYNGLAAHAASAGLDTQTNKWDQIFDFTEKEAGKNFELLPAAQFSLFNVPFPELGEPQMAFPLPKSFGGTLDENAPNQKNMDEGGMMSFGIHTTAVDAEKFVAQ